MFVGFLTLRGRIHYRKKSTDHSLITSITNNAYDYTEVYNSKLVNNNNNTIMKVDETSRIIASSYQVFLKCVALLVSVSAEKSKRILFRLINPLSYNVWMAYIFTSSYA